MCHYCPIITKGHPLAMDYPLFVKKICDVIAKEARGTSVLIPQNIECVIDSERMNAKVAKKNRRNQYKIVDFVFGVDTEHLVFVECKFRLNPENLTKDDDIDGKIEGTLMLFGRSVPKHPVAYFVFDKENVQGAINRIARLSGGDPVYQDCHVACSIDDVINKFF